MKSTLNVKKASNLIKGICSHKICSGIKSQRVKNKLFVIQYQKLLIFLSFLKYSVPFHRVTFDHSISCVLLIDKPNEWRHNSKKIKRNAISTKKKLLKRKGNSITPAQTNAPISQTSLEDLKLRKKELKMKLGQLQEKISKVSLPIIGDLCNNFKSV